MSVESEDLIGIALCDTAQTKTLTVLTVRVFVWKFEAERGERDAFCYDTVPLADACMRLYMFGL